MANKVIQVHLRDLQTKFDVRKKLNDDQVYNLACLYEAGETLPPLLITKQMEIIDGRHRKAAMELAGREVADCVISTEEDNAANVIHALKSNIGGPLPPSREDIIHTIVLLYTQGWRDQKILANLPFPRSVSRKYVAEAAGFVLRQKLQQAMRAMTEDDLTVKQAAERYGVPEEKIKEHMNPNRKKKTQQSAKWRKQHMSRAYNGFGVKVASLLQKELNAFEDNEASEEEVLAAFDHVSELINKHIKRMDEHRLRFQNASREMRKIGSVELATA